MNYQDYKDARDASWRILIDCEVTELPVRISGVCRALGVSVRRYTPAERDSNDGMSTVIGGAPTIMVSNNHGVQPDNSRAAALYLRA